MTTEKKILAGAAAACALLTVPAAAFGADVDRSGYVDQRLPVKVDQLLVYKDVDASFTGSLQRGETFKVERLSPSGTYAYGFAYGSLNRHAYVKTSGLEPGTSSGGTGGPQLIRTPSVRYTFNRKQGLGRYLTLTAVFRTDRRLDRSRYTTMAAPKLTRGQKLPQRLFGGLTPRTTANNLRNGKYCYVGELTLDRQRKALNGNRSWRMGLRRASEVTQGRLKHVTLKRAPKRDFWEERAARRLGC